MRAPFRLVAMPTALLLALFAFGCRADRPPTAEEVVTAFADAVQERDAVGLYCLSAGAVGAESLGGDAESRQEGFNRWFSEELLRYEAGRDEGEISLSGHGVQLVKLFALGRGTFYLTSSRRSEAEGALALVTDLQFGYAQIDLSRLSPGTTFYVASSPPGRVLPIEVPSGAKEISVEALESIKLEWSLTRGDERDRCAAGWRVASVAVVPGSAQTTSIRWIF